ncbi:MAG TPA: hypothetical protein VGZ89_17775 [Xanthobacteraceae bacterium]|jgi:hypothetical protein|nr:hypothetical protein [Xanthobacteraceae bacterium]
MSALFFVGSIICGALTAQFIISQMVVGRCRAALLRERGWISGLAAVTAAFLST